ncbi:TldD/PmbA family protein [Paenibacillus amylolyticus]|uniref:TldD/PmbA family protein n=1 Tax=Paenibacillus amylolyticus TaxID=1451 RepID=UPI003242F926
MRRYADYYGTELCQKSWIMTEMESLYSERKGCGSSLRRWNDDQFYSCIRPLSNYTNVKNQNWSQWSCDTGVSGVVPHRSDPKNIYQPHLEIYQPVSTHTVDHILREGKEMIFSIADLIVSPTLFFETEEKTAFYQDTEGREHEKRETQHTVSVLVQGKSNRASTTFSFRSMIDLDWQSLCGELNSQLQTQAERPKRSVNHSSIILTEQGTEELLKALGNLFISDYMDTNVPVLWQKQGKRIASPALTLTDCAHLPKLLRSSSFDDEGALCKDIALIKNGVFNEALHSLSSSTRHKQMANGRAFRKDYQTMPKIQYTNLKVEEGSHSTEELITRNPSGFLLNRSYGGHIRGGKLVFGAEGWRIHNNTLVERLTQVQIEAPLFQMLRSIDPATDGYSNTLGRGFISPSLYVENVSVIY